jgi:hypothetical protein
MTNNTVTNKFLEASKVKGATAAFTVDPPRPFAINLAPGSHGLAGITFAPTKKGK